MTTRQTADYDPMMDELPPDLAAEYMAEKRRREIIEAMFSQSQTPLVAPEVKGRFQGAISPWQGIAKIAQAYMANKGLEASDAAMAALGTKRAEGERSAWDKVSQAMRGTPATPDSMVPMAVGNNPDKQTGDRFQAGAVAVPGSVDAGMQAAMDSPYTRKISQEMLLEKMKNQVKPAESPWAKVDAKDYTPESLTQFATTKNPADLRAVAKSGKGSDQIIQYEYSKTPDGGNYKGTFSQFKTLGPSITAAAIAPLREAQVGNINDENAYNLPQKNLAIRAPASGQVDGGYRFKGGDPADKNNWEKL